MSIINEALKKTDEQLKKYTPLNNSLPPKTSKFRSFLLYVLILLAGLWLGNFIFNQLSHLIQGTPAPKQDNLTPAQIAPEPAPAAPINQPAEEIKPPKSNFILNGIFFSNNDGYALVNNQIVRENDYVDGAKVSSITSNTVELDNAGEVITLSTRR